MDIDFEKIIFWYLFGLGFIIGCFVVFVFYNSELSEEVDNSQYDWGSEEPQMGHYWVCMEGCSNMQELIYGPKLYKIEGMKELHDKCAEICWKQLGFDE